VGSVREEVVSTLAPEEEPDEEATVAVAAEALAGVGAELDAEAEVDAETDAEVDAEQGEGGTVMVVASADDPSATAVVTITPKG
jgi:hypothetical protein